MVTVNEQAGPKPQPAPTRETLFKCTGFPECGIHDCAHAKEHTAIVGCLNGCFNGSYCRPVKNG